MEKLVDDTSTLLSARDTIFLDGNWVGVCGDSLSFVAALRRKRRWKEVPHQVNWLKRRSIFRHFCLKMEIMILLASVGWNS
jgi:hypothetical protein